jgi:hypothetical protein
MIRAKTSSAPPAAKGTTKRVTDTGQAPSAWASGAGPVQAVARSSNALRRESRMPAAAANASEPAARDGPPNRERKSILGALIVILFPDGVLEAPPGGAALA